MDNDDGGPVPLELPTGPAAASIASEGMENTAAAAAAASVPQNKAEIIQRMRDELSKHVNSVSLCAELPTLVTCLCPPPGSKLYEQKRNSSGSCEMLLHNIVRGGIDSSDKHLWTEGCIRWTMRFDEVAGRYDETSITKVGQMFILDRRKRHEHGHPVRVRIGEEHLQNVPSVGTIRVKIAWLESTDEFLRPTPAQFGIATFGRWYRKTATSTAFTQAAPMVGEFLNDCSRADNSEDANVMLTTTILPFQRRCSTSSVVVMEAYTTREVTTGEELLWPYSGENVQNEVINMLNGSVGDTLYADQQNFSVDEFVESVPAFWQPQLRMIVSDYSAAKINPVVHRQANWRLRCDADLGGGRLHVAFKTSEFPEQLQYVPGTESWLYPQLEVASDTVAVKDVDTPVTNHMSVATRQRGVFAERNIQEGTRVAVMCGIPVNTVLLFALVAVCGMNAIERASSGAAVRAYFKGSQRAFPNKLSKVLLDIMELSRAAKSDDIFDQLAHWKSLLDEVNSKIFDNCIDRMANDANLLVGDSTSMIQKSIMQMYNRVVNAVDGLHQLILLPGGYISQQNMQMLQYLLYGTPGDDELMSQIEDATTWSYDGEDFSVSKWLPAGLQTYKTPSKDALDSFYEQPRRATQEMLRNRLCVVRVAQEPLPALQKIDFLRMAAAMQAATAAAGTTLHPLFIRQAGIVMMLTASAEYSNTYQLFSTNIEVAKVRAGDTRAAKSPQTVTATMNKVFAAFFTKHIREFEFQAFRWLLAATRVDLYQRSYAVLMSEFPAEVSDSFTITRIVEWTVQTATGSKSQTLCILSTDQEPDKDEILTEFPDSIQFVANPESRRYKLDEIVNLLSLQDTTATNPRMLPYIGNIGQRRGNFSKTRGVLQRFHFARPGESDDTEIATAALGHYVFNLLKVYRENAFVERKYNAAAVAVQQVVEQQFEVSCDNVPLQQWSLSNRQFAQKYENYRIWSAQYDVDVVADDDKTTVVISGPDAGRTADLARSHRQTWNWVVPHEESSVANTTSALKKLVTLGLINKTRAQNSSTLRSIASDLLKNQGLHISDIGWLKLQFARNDYETAQNRFETGRLPVEKIVAPALPTSLDGRWQKAQASCMPWSQRDENASDAARGDATSTPAFCREPAVVYEIDRSPANTIARPVKRPRTDSGASATPADPDVDDSLVDILPSGGGASATPADPDVDDSLVDILPSGGGASATSAVPIDPEVDSLTTDDHLVDIALGAEDPSAAPDAPTSSSRTDTSIGASATPAVPIDIDTSIVDLPTNFDDFDDEIDIFEQANLDLDASGFDVPT